MQNRKAVSAYYQSEQILLCAFNRAGMMKSTDIGACDYKILTFYPSKDKTLNQCWFYVGPYSRTNQTHVHILTVTRIIINNILCLILILCEVWRDLAITSIGDRHIMESL